MLGNPPHEGALRRVNAPSEQAWPTCHNMHKEEWMDNNFISLHFCIEEWTC